MFGKYDKGTNKEEEMKPLMEMSNITNYHGKEDSNPENKWKSKRNYCRTTSCFGEPSHSALNYLTNGDLAGFSEILSSIASLDDYGSGKNSDYPLKDSHWVNGVYNDDNTNIQFKTLLQISIEGGESKFEFTKLLIRAGASANLYNDHLGICPIHVAVKHGNFKALQLLSEDCGFNGSNLADVNAFDRQGQTILHIATKNNDLKLLGFILNHSELSNVDPEDLNGRKTPLWIAIQGKYSQVTKLLLEHGASLKNVVFGKTCLELLHENLPLINPDSINVKNGLIINSDDNDTEYVINRLMDKAQLIRRKGESISQLTIHFNLMIQRSLSNSHLEQMNLHGMTLFQKACSYGLHEFVELLLDIKLNPNSITNETSSPGVLLAAYNGYWKVLEALRDHKLNNWSNNEVQTVDFTILEKFGGESILHWILKKPNRDGYLQNDPVDYAKSLQLLLDQGPLEQDMIKIVNFQDNLGNSALHYATMLWDQDIVQRLLELGANIGLKNIWGENPISKILPETMEDYLDQFCLNSKYDVNNEDFNLTFNYSFLAPPIPNLISNDSNQEPPIQPETESLWYMSQSKTHRHLLKHPVITSFLWLKWQRIRGYFNRNLRFYFLFVMCLTWYIFERFGGISSRTTKLIFAPNNASYFCTDLELRSTVDNHGFWFYTFIFHSLIHLILYLRDIRKDLSEGIPILRILSTSWLEYLTMIIIGVVIYFQTKALFYVISGLLGLLIAREVFQLSVSIKRYIFTPENWLEIVMITLVGVILYMPNYNFENACETKRHLAAITILLSWAEMITLVARHPRLSRYNTYVLMFYKVLKTFFFFLLWYSFFIIAFGLGFYIMLHKDLPGMDLTNSEDYQFFNYPWLALVKTSTMFVGEIEFSDIPIDTNNTNTSPIAYAFLLAFVFLILVVLMNLLNGLAVSDTGMIRDKAEIVGFVSRVETISYTESLLLGDPFDFLSNWPAFQWLKSLPSFAICRMLFSNSTVRDVSHKITGATGLLLFYSTLPDKTLTIYPNKTDTDVCSKVLGLKDMDPNVVKAAKNKILKLRAQHKVSNEQKSLDVKVQELQKSIDNMNEKLDFLLNKIINK